MLRWPSTSARVGIGVLLVILALGIDRVAFAQLQITEVSTSFVCIAANPRRPATELS